MNPHALAIIALLSLALSACDQSPPTPAPIAPKLSAIQQLVAEADAGNVNSQIALAKRYADGEEVERDERKAYSLYLQAATAGNVDAMMEVIARLRGQRGTTWNHEEKKKWVRAAADKGNAEAQRLLAEEYAWTLNDRVVVDGEGEQVSENLKKWRELLEQSSGRGNVAAKYELGWGYLLGTTPHLFGRYDNAYASVPDVNKGLGLLTEAGNENEWRAQYALAVVYQVGYATIKANKEVSSGWWDRLDKHVDPVVQAEIGERFAETNEKYYTHGKNKWKGKALSFYETNQLAADWFLRAARNSHAGAALALGQMHLEGRGVLKDEVAAFSWFTKAADAGLPEAQYRVGLAQVNGTGTSKSYTSAIRQFLLVANGTGLDATTAKAKNALGAMSEYGWGTERDLVVAYAWYNLAAGSKHDKAKENLARVEKLLDSDSIQRGQELSAQWKPGAGIGPEATPVSATAKDAVPKAGGTRAVASGTGILISSDGRILTNNHVVANCKEIRIPALDKTAKVLVADASNDLALLLTEGAFPTYAKFSDKEEGKQGEEVVVFGYPLEGFLPSSGNVTMGIVAALAGPGNNASLIQITAPVQPGNSGGAVLDRKGRVVGIVVGKADAIKVAKVTGDIPQNINFAVSSRTVKAFLDGNRVEYKSEGGLFTFSQSADKLADEARAFSVKLECRQ